MPSEVALAIAKRNKETIETVGALRLADDADAELQEVREVLDDLKAENGDCWCAYFGGNYHSEECERTQRLYQRLRVDGKENENAKV